MKTSKLIELLQKADPEGNYEVLIGNSDILPITYSEPGYWDGRMRLAEYKDGETQPYRIVKSGYGQKINLYPIDEMELFTDSLIYYQKEFEYSCSKDNYSDYPYLLSTKIGWLYYAESYAGWTITFKEDHEKRKKTLDLIEELKNKYAQEAKDNALYWINSRVKGNAKTKAIEVINKIYEHSPHVVLQVSFGATEVFIQSVANYTYTFAITLPTLGFGGGDLKIKIPIEKGETSDGYGRKVMEYNDNIFEIFAEKIAEYYKRKANNE